MKLKKITNIIKNLVEDLDNTVPGKVLARKKPIRPGSLDATKLAKNSPAPPQSGIRRKSPELKTPKANFPTQHSPATGMSFKGISADEYKKKEKADNDWYDIQMTKSKLGLPDQPEDELPPVGTHELADTGDKNDAWDPNDYGLHGFYNADTPEEDLGSSVSKANQYARAARRSTGLRPGAKMSLDPIFSEFEPTEEETEELKTHTSLLPKDKKQQF